MSKIFVFGIGGTGSRVLRSLTMLLASGVRFGADEIVPVIIDPDNANADLTRTVALLNNYASIRKSLHFGSDTENRFFRTDIESFLPNYTLHINDTDDKSFREFINYASMSKPNQALTKMLFSDKNLASSMEVGFKGNPNIGSVVLNQIAHSDDFQEIANKFSAGDHIFIISSIFGGTGASGFPLLLKTLRTGNNFPNYNLINQAQIGAVTILPYFKLRPDEESEIDSSTFISKTKSALAYYENNIIKNNSINALYYLADDVANTYDNHEGGSSQQNAAHLIEFLGATAIIDFSNSQFANPANMELGIRESDGSVSFGSFYRKMHDMLYRPMSQFALMSNALTHKLDTYRASSFAANNGNFEDLYSGAFFNELSDLLRKYQEWLKEMKDNKRPLDLFNLNCGDKPFDLVTGVKPKRILSKHSDYNLVTDRLNSAVRKCKSKGKEDKFLEMFFHGTRQLVSEKLSN
ncbi:MAG: hypothetical protein NC344_02225 [Bacteroidales bacterium]|nr:hypothetical protein [Bacteroidales bacterium]MCM1146649.1 hypothetical protein [Bacteroidales bacterium]MCM1206041.1 hypothetical protein [Bacillota bacterium]MCM1511059.1 hypothetical protein [Clostridium sp.]